MPFQKGHPRFGGMKKGQKTQATIDKEHHRQLLAQIVVDELGPMTRAQVEHAKGVQYMVLRMPDGTYARATDVKQIDAACAVGASAFKIMTQAPNTQAYVALLDRTLDKPKEQKQEIDLKIEFDLAEVLKKARKRADK